MRFRDPQHRDQRQLKTTDHHAKLSGTPGHCHRVLLALCLGLLALGLLPMVATAVDLEPLEQQRAINDPKALQATPARPSATPLEQQLGTANKARTSRPAATKAPKRAANKTRQTSQGGPDISNAAGNDDGMLFNFQDAEIKAVIKTISQLTGTNFILDPRVKGKITIISAKPVSKSAAYDIFLTAIKAQGFTVADVRPGVLKIIPVGEGKQNASVRQRAIRHGAELMVSQVVVIQHGTATAMVPLLRPLMAPTSQLSAYSPANALIITDYADNVQRIMNLIGRIDQPLSTDVTIIPLEHASALDMAELISQLVQSRGTTRGAPKGGTGIAAGSRTSIVPDLRTNSLLIRSDNPGRVAQLRTLINKLDVPAKTEGNTRVIYLRNAEATKLVEVIRGLLEAEARSAKPAAGARGAAASKASQSSLIQADEDTNSLIINAPDAVYNNLRGVIEKLDARRAQVYVECIIVEIGHEDAMQLGFQWAAADNIGQGVIAGVTNFPASGSGLLSTITNPESLAGASGLTLAYVGDTIRLPDGSEVRGIGGLIRALEERNIANILSTPNVLTLDNAEAKIVVGQNVPFLTGSFTQSTSGADNPFQTIERKDVGITLEIKPQITEGGSVKLEITTEASSVARGTLVAQDLITNTRTLQTTVVVEDGHSIVLGGLIQDTYDNNQEMVPFLGRIPLLGWLFKYREKRVGKTNLMVFLRPTIVRKSGDTLAFTRNRYDYILGEQRRMKGPEEGEKALRQFSPDHNRSSDFEDAYPEGDDTDDETDETIEFPGMPNTNNKATDAPVPENELLGPTPDPEPAKAPAAADTPS